jgi:hypothetical protein
MTNSPANISAITPELEEKSKVAPEQVTSLLNESQKTIVESIPSPSYGEEEVTQEPLLEKTQSIAQETNIKPNDVPIDSLIGLSKDNKDAREKEVIFNELITSAHGNQ